MGLFEAVCSKSGTRGGDRGGDRGFMAGGGDAGVHVGGSGGSSVTGVREADNYALLLIRLERYGEVSKLLRKLTPMARRVLGEGHEITLGMRTNYAQSLYEGPGATLEDLREAVTTLEETSRTARRILGSEHPTTKTIEWHFKKAQAALRAREEA